ncbi:hypothetical protein J4403_00975 [Candidatus Woesearchaeota archaeon]|nr:hypothetical protein [Candidatus Woesearchaeota archaeon]
MKSAKNSSKLVLFIFILIIMSFSMFALSPPLDEDINCVSEGQERKQTDGSNLCCNGLNECLAKSSYTSAGYIPSKIYCRVECENGEILRGAITPKEGRETKKSTQWCKDTDFGLNYNKKGIILIKEKTENFLNSRVLDSKTEVNVYQDVCKDGNILLEASCKNVEGIEYDCSSENKICKNGRCINPIPGSSAYLYNIAPFTEITVSSKYGEVDKEFDNFYGDVEKIIDSKNDEAHSFYFGDKKSNDVNSAQGSSVEFKFERRYEVKKIVLKKTKAEPSTQAKVRVSGLLNDNEVKSETYDFNSEVLTIPINNNLDEIKLIFEGLKNVGEAEIYIKIGDVSLIEDILNKIGIGQRDFDNIQRKDITQLPDLSALPQGPKTPPRELQIPPKGVGIPVGPSLGIGDCIDMCQDPSTGEFLEIICGQSCPEGTTKDQNLWIIPSVLCETNTGKYNSNCVCPEGKTKQIYRCPVGETCATVITYECVTTSVSCDVAPRNANCVCNGGLEKQQISCLPGRACIPEKKYACLPKGSTLISEEEAKQIIAANNECEYSLSDPTVSVTYRDLYWTARKEGCGGVCRVNAVTKVFDFGEGVNDFNPMCTGLIPSQSFGGTGGGGGGSSNSIVSLIFTRPRILLESAEIIRPIGSSQMDNFLAENNLRQQMLDKTMQQIVENRQQLSQINLPEETDIIRTQTDILVNDYSSQFVGIMDLNNKIEQFQKDRINQAIISPRGDLQLNNLRKRAEDLQLKSIETTRELDIPLRKVEPFKINSEVISQFKKDLIKGTFDINKANIKIVPGEILTTTTLPSRTAPIVPTTSTTLREGAQRLTVGKEILLYDNRHKVKLTKINKDATADLEVIRIADNSVRNNLPSVKKVGDKANAQDVINSRIINLACVEITGISANTVDVIATSGACATNSDIATTLITNPMIFSRSISVKPELSQIDNKAIIDNKLITSENIDLIKKAKISANFELMNAKKGQAFVWDSQSVEKEISLDWDTPQALGTIVLTQTDGSDKTLSTVNKVKIVLDSTSIDINLNSNFKAVNTINLEDYVPKDKLKTKHIGIIMTEPSIGKGQSGGLGSIIMYSEDYNSWPCCSGFNWGFQKRKCKVC